MMTLFDDEYILEAYLKERGDNAVKETEKRIAERVIKKGKLSLDEIAEYVSALTMEELKEIEAEVMRMA